jgi:hypothetical protein
MIRLRPDCLAFKTTDGDSIPCSAEQVVVELIGDAAQWLDKEVITHASQAVLHYFRNEKGQETVSVGEFVEALERVLKGLGFQVKAATSSSSVNATAHSRVIEADLRDLANASNGGAELFFFPLLRRELQQRLDGSPLVLLFRGLRECVKQIVGAKRWNPSCQDLNDRIVDYLRTCLSNEKANAGCSLVVM